jgi:hypothetical protein
MNHIAIGSRLRTAIRQSYDAVWWASTRLRTIRGRILIAFLIMSVITGALGGYAARGISRARDLVTRTFDQSLMSINYARAASADFAAMQAAFARRWIVSDPAQRGKLDAKVELLDQSLADDLAISAERSQSARAEEAATSVQRAVTAWAEIRRRMIEGNAPDAAWDELDGYAEIVDQQIDLLVNYTAGE